MYTSCLLRKVSCSACLPIQAPVLNRQVLQKEVADIIGVTESSVWNREHGTEPKLQYNPSIIKFLGYIPFACPDGTVGRVAWCEKCPNIKPDTFNIRSATQTP